MRTLITIALLSLPCFAQEKAVVKEQKAPTAISAEDQLALRNAQVAAMKLDAQRTQVETLLRDAQSRQQDLYHNILAKYHINSQKQVICDGPGPQGTACEGVDKDAIVVRDIKTPEEKATR